MAKRVSKEKSKTENVKKERRIFGGLRRAKKPREKVELHKSFKRSYREECKRDLEVPGMMYHIFATFRIIFRNWKLFLPLLLFAMGAAVLFVGLMSEDTYQQFQTILDETTAEAEAGDIGPVATAGLLLISTVTTGGLSGGSSESAAVFAVLIFLVLWLTTIFLLRHRLAGHKVKLRDGLYNGMGPLLSTLAVFVVAVVQCVPIIVLVIVYSAAVQTNFLATPFYALLFFIFAMLMLLLSGYLLSSTLMALIAVTAPGLYPMEALRTASNLMAGRRIRFVLRIIALLILLVVMWVLVMMPLILFDLWLKQFEWASLIPFVPVCLLAMTCFTGIYISAYFYMYYRWMLNYEEK